MALKDWSLTAADNDTVTDATYGNISWAENQNPNTVNDSSRAEMAHVRAFYETLEWRDWGHTPTRTGNTTFTIPTTSSLSSVYCVGRRIRLVDATTFYGTITATTYNGSSLQTITVLAGTNLSASLASVALGFDPTNSPLIAPVRGFMAVKTADSTVATGIGTLTAMTFGPAASYDTESCYDAATGTVTIPAWVGKVRWSTNVQWEASSVGNRLTHIYLESGTTSTPVPRWVIPGNGSSFVGGTTGWVPVTPGNTYRVRVSHDSTGDLDVIGTDSFTYFAAEFAP